METAIVAVICIALIIVGGMTMSQGFLYSVDSTTLGLETVSERDEEIMRTDLSTLSANQTSPDTLQVTLKNDGQTKLASFTSWDVIVQYYDSGGTYYVKWLPYVEGAPGNNEWRRTGIYLNAENLTAEAFEPGILNPGEEMVIEAKLNPPVGEETANLAVISTANGVPVSVQFTGYTP